jgi:flagellar biogenesis protein FliO
MTRIPTKRRFDWKGPSMHGFARSAVWLAAIGLAATTCRTAAADFPDPYAEPAATSNYAQPASHEAPSAWPSAPAAPSTASPPRLLPDQSEPHRPLPREAPVRSYGSATPASAESRISQPPIPLSRDATAALAPFGGGDLEPLASTAASLGIVLGLFVLVVWAVRRGMPRGSGLLPSDAVEVLGRAPFVGRQQVHLVRCGHKLVLVTVTPSGTQTLTEISDPAEVERLLHLCQGGASPGGLRHWLGHLTHAGRGSDFRERPDDVDFGHLEVGQHRARGVAS